MVSKIAILHDFIQGIAASAEDKGKDIFDIRMCQEEARTICHALIDFEHEYEMVKLHVIDELQAEVNSPEFRYKVVQSKDSIQDIICQILEEMRYEKMIEKEGEE